MHLNPGRRQQSLTSENNDYETPITAQQVSSWNILVMALTQPRCLASCLCEQPLAGARPRLQSCTQESTGVAAGTPSRCWEKFLTCSPFFHVLGVPNSIKYSSLHGPWTRTQVARPCNGSAVTFRCSQSLFAQSSLVGFDKERKGQRTCLKVKKYGLKTRAPSPHTSSSAAPSLVDRNWSLPL